MSRQAQDTARREKVLEVVRGLSAELNPGREIRTPGDSASLDYDLGIGSLERLELTTRLERALGASISGDAVFQARSVGDLSRALGGAPPAPTPSPAPPSPGAGHAPPPPAHVGTLVEMLEAQALAQPERETLILLSEGRQQQALRYQQVLDEARALAAGLARLGITHGDRVALMLPTGLDFIASFFGALILGAVPVPLYPPFRPDQIEEHLKRQATIVDDAGAPVMVTFKQAWGAARVLQALTPKLRHVVVADELRGHGETRGPRLAESDLAFIQYTSGSTSAPKGVALTHANLLANIRAFGNGLEIISDDVCVSWLPLYHDMGLIGALLGSFYYGLPLPLMGPQDFLARPSRWLWALHEYRGSISAAPNFAYELCARKVQDSELEGLDLSRWRIALNGAEAVRPETVRRFYERFKKYGLPEETMFPVYGLAEASLAVTFPPVGRAPRIDCVDRERLEREGRAWPVQGLIQGESPSGTELVSCGRAVEQVEVRVHDPKGRPLDERCVGRIVFRGASAMQGYFNNPQATAKTRDAEGWIDSGDEGYLADGELYVVGRRKDLILKAGRNLHPEDVEDAVSDVPGIRRGCVAAFSVPDEATGTESLIVVAETRSPSDALQEAVAAAVTRAVSVPPDRVVLVQPQSVPKTPSGKIRRSECQARWLDGTLGRRRTLVGQALSLVRQVAERVGQRVLEWPARMLYGGWYWGMMVGAWGTLRVAGIINPRLARRISPALGRGLLRAIGLRLEVRGPLPGDRPCVVVANHGSIIDPFVVVASCPMPLRFVVAPWVSKLPLVRDLLAPMGYVAVRRGHAGSAAAEVERVGAVLAEGDCVAAFPEGGLEQSPGLRPFTLGIFHAAVAGDVPVIPLSIDGARRALPWPQQIPNPGVIRVTFGAPLLGEGEPFEAATGLARRAREEIARHCGEPLAHQRLRRED